MSRIPETHGTEATIQEAQRALQGGEFAKAISLFHTVLNQQPDQLLLLKLGLILQELKQFEGALNCFRRALENDPGNAEIHKALGDALQKAGSMPLAISSWRQVVELRPDHAEAWQNLGLGFEYENRLEEALQAHNRACELRPRDPVGLRYLGMVHQDLGNLEKAREYYQRAIDLAPEDAETRWQIFFLKAAQGQFPDAWEEYEWRHRLPHRSKTKIDLKQPIWDGSDLDGRTILLHGEQGFGDNIQAARYVPLVAARSGKVLLWTPRELVSLFQSIPGTEEVFSELRQGRKFDVHLPLMSLPRVFGSSLETIPKTVPYLKVAAEREWPFPIAESNRLKVGLAWCGSRSQKNDRRPVPFGEMSGLLDAPCEFFSLQTGSPRADAREVFASGGMTDLSPWLKDFEATAAAMGRMDLVITVDTAVAHLAGALGKPVWVLLSFAPDWRWLRDREESPWYPTMRLFRQTAPGDWKPVFERVRSELRKWAENAAGEFHEAEGLRHIRQGNLAEAREHFATAAEIQPGNPVWHFNHGLACQNLGQLDGAIAAYRRAVQLQPAFFEAWTNLSAALKSAGAIGESLQAAQSAVRLRPEASGAHLHLGNALRAQGCISGAIAAYEKAVELDPGNPQNQMNLANCHRDAGEMDRAICLLQEIVSRNPDCAEAHRDLAFALLLGGRLPEGWVENEWRWRTKEMAPKWRAFSKPLWRGEPLQGRTLLVHQEQGFGDSIQFARYIQLVKESGGHVLLECQPAMRRLFATLAGVDQMVTRGEPLPDFDLHIPLLSLPNLFRTELATIPNAVPYLRAPQGAHFPMRKEGFLRVGLVWAGNPKHRNDPLRSMEFSALTPLLELDPMAVEFCSLQCGERAADLANSPWRGRVIAAELKDFADTAAVVEQLDLVISVDTAVAHLAGAMGKKVFLLLPFSPDWRWLREREDSPWYPTMRLFRQERPGDWIQPVEKVRNELESLSVANRK